MKSFSQKSSMTSYLVPLIEEENDVDIVTNINNEIAINEKTTLTNNRVNNKEQIVRSLATTMTTNDYNNDTFQQQQQHNPAVRSNNNNNCFTTIKSYLHVLFVFFPLLIWNTIRLLLFVLLLLIPGFIRIGWYYFISSKRISCRYQTLSCRQTLDIYGAVVSSDHIDDRSEIDSSPTTNTRNINNHRSSSSNVTTPPTTTTTTNKKPVLIFAPGGAWLIG